MRYQSNAVVNIAFVEYSPGVILSDVFFNMLLICNTSPPDPTLRVDLFLLGSYMRLLPSTAKSELTPGLFVDKGNAILFPVPTSFPVEELEVNDKVISAGLSH
ncbi:hypothetical protein XBKQ1_430001 [Xenorhabdus bovienii str. kraussei Quebec]|uniref:Uncharacterized protein n=1 Tax=Xenorhabdus bovienii str. kraussei Quebec TaxID=1398203 RepID=A0A077PK71_XENBV|nr:hypothetical protein XBKQ1_430001 [Xenorhabdus bovienii str. kraussei Quebec]